jgi:hypothetical protein
LPDDGGLLVRDFARAGIDAQAPIVIPWAERLGRGYFTVMGRAIRAVAPPASIRRAALIPVYVLGLALLIVLLLPLVTVAWRIWSKFRLNSDNEHALS